jgi:DNA-binding MarR family transcriptional regulator
LAVEERLRECLGLRTGAAYRRLDRYYNRGFEKVGLTHAHAQALLCLLKGGEQRMTAIAQTTGFEQSTVSRLMQELTNRRFVLRRPDPADGRAQLLRAGAKARALKAELERIQRRLNDRLRREIDSDDLHGFFGVTEVFNRLP